MATGAVAGLVGITPAAGFVSPASGMLIGAITSSLCLLSVNLKIKLSFDDSLDTFAVHGVGGTVGAILTGLFAKSDLIASHPAGIVLREQGRFALILGQFQAVLIAYAIAAIGTFIIAMFLKFLGFSLRVNEKEEESGLDISQHGEDAYGRS